MKRKASLLLPLVLLAAVFCSCDSNSNVQPAVSQQEESSTVSALSDSSVSVPQYSKEQLLADYYVEGIPILENNFYRMLTGAEIFKDKEPEIVLQTSDPPPSSGLHTTFCRDSDFY
ncbi:MAG: hypothetical protein Q4G07_10695 [Oscillospiraceae bacterium]|nr:hypothetical protein [Oscillospiraceae bacterium]